MMFARKFKVRVRVLKALITSLKNSDALESSAHMILNILGRILDPNKEMKSKFLDAPVNGSKKGWNEARTSNSNLTCRFLANHSRGGRIRLTFLTRLIEILKASPPVLQTKAASILEFLTAFESCSYVFVCAHNSRDKRCGVCGPVLIKKFNEEIGVRGLKDEVFVGACSHVGGHKYAWNLIIYSKVQDEKVSGHWYGYVTPNDVADLLDQHIKKGEIIERIWRGEIGVPPVEKAEKVVEQTLPNGNDMKENAKDEKENTGGCCQGANGFSCCRVDNSEVKKDWKKSTYKFDFFTRRWEL
ncbi:putative thioredoxin-like ferredoxin, Thioredoxin-like superfamily [Helianthus debilis subsp. tardiflorus]